MKVDLDLALKFIYQHGNVIDRARVNAIFENKPCSTEVSSYFTKLQNCDGGFPYKQIKGLYSTISDTEYIFTWLKDLNMINTETFRKALSFLASVQKADGSWDENAKIWEYDPPNWMKPGSRSATIFNTANTIFWFSIYGREYDSLISKGYEFLLNYQKSTGEFEGFIHNTWLGVSVFGILEGWESERVKKGLDYLSSIPNNRWITSQVTWMLWDFLLTGIPKDNFFIKRMLKIVKNRQKSDGSFLSEDGNKYSVNATIEAIKVLKMFL